MQVPLRKKSAETAIQDTKENSRYQPLSKFSWEDCTKFCLILQANSQSLGKVSVYMNRQWTAGVCRSNRQHSRRQLHICGCLDFLRREIRPFHNGAVGEGERFSQVYRTTTVDKAPVFSGFAQQVFFAHPCTPWEYPQNERHSGQAFVSKDISMEPFFSPKQILSAAYEQKERPRKKLGFRLPEERFEAFLRDALRKTEMR